MSAVNNALEQLKAEVPDLTEILQNSMLWTKTEIQSLF